ncbi:MAG TPA: PAS domain S-box protein, partial [bacterium]|nr:PAS domain S-box protein [bacterium]
MESKIRSSGIDIIGNTPWGTHFCLFYQTKEDLIDILVPYFKAGLENNEYCMWVTSEPLDEKEAEKAIRVAIPNFDEYLLRNQIEIIPYTEWYIKNNEFDSDRVLNGWVDKCNSALEEGFTGLRLTGNTFWLEQKDWNDFKDYEEEINNVIGNFQMMAICTYSLEKCGSVELLDVIQNHQFALIRRENSWSIFKSSEQTRIEQQLKESEILYRTTVNGFQDPLHVINQDLEIILINDVLKQSVKKFNLDTNLVGKTIREAFPFLLDNVLDEYRSVFNNKKPLITVENTFLGGKEITTETRKIPIFDDEENVFQIITIIRDITERKNAEQKLKESEEKWKALSENSPAIVSLLDREHKIFSINRTAPDLSKEEVIGSSVYNYVPPEFLQVARDSFNSVWKTGEPNTYAQKYITKEGETRFFEVWIGPIFQSGKVFALVSHSMDVTEKKQAEQKLKESEEKWRALSENSPAQIALLDLEQKILFINRTAPDLSQDEVIGKSVYIFVPKDYIQIAKESYKLVIDTGKPSSFTTEYISKDGSISFFDVWIGPIFESGKIVTLISHSLDITKRKKAEQKLKESEEKYRTLFESSKDGIIFSNMDGKIMDCNQAYLNMLGYTLVEIQE